MLRGCTVKLWTPREPLVSWYRKDFYRWMASWYISSTRRDWWNYKLLASQDQHIFRRIEDMQCCQSKMNFWAKLITVWSIDMLETWHEYTTRSDFFLAFRRVVCNSFTVHWDTIKPETRMQSIKLPENQMMTIVEIYWKR